MVGKNNARLRALYETLLKIKCVGVSEAQIPITFGVHMSFVTSRE